jgi:hypothetical protein
MVRESITVGLVVNFEFLMIRVNGCRGEENPSKMCSVEKT